MRIKHPGYLAASAVLIGAGGLLLASQLMPAALASIGTGLVVGAKKGLHFGKEELAKAEKSLPKPTAKKSPAKKTAKRKSRRG